MSIATFSRRRTLVIFLLVTCWPLASALDAADVGNRLTYLDDFCDPYYVHAAFPKLTTPQWVGESGVEAVITLGIDDMRDPKPYEKYLRPILERLKKIDGRAPVSIMTNSTQVEHPQLQAWLREGLSIECHTIDHPCPCLNGGDFAAAKSTYDRCVDQMAGIANNRPVAFRFPCMDSLNTPSPRAFAEILARTTKKGKFLEISSSVSCMFTVDDAELPRKLVFGAAGPNRFSKYVPFPSYVNKIENYPYPYVIGHSIWEFPTAVPDDWQAQNLHRPKNPQTVEDLKAVVDATVVKRGVMNNVFHPYDWIGNHQVVNVIDYVVKTHGKKVKFLTFRECAERISRHLLSGQPLRSKDGGQNGVRLLDVNHDGYLDVVIGNEHVRKTRLWSPQQKKWIESDFPVRLVVLDPLGNRRDAGVRFGILRPDGYASMLAQNGQTSGGWHFDGSKWIEDKRLLAGLALEGRPVLTSHNGQDQGVRLRDLDGDGRCELVVGNPKQNAAFEWDTNNRRWKRLPFSLPQGTSIVDARGNDAGLRFVDVDEDGHNDVIFSNEQHYSLHLFESMKDGWVTKALAGRRGDPESVPMIVRGGTNNGAWFHSRHMWVQNEDTSRLPNLVDRRSFDHLLKYVLPRERSTNEAVSTMRPRPGFAVELVAAEPLVMDPIAFDWGPDGKFWVVEMADYPLGIDGKGKPGGRARFLEDTDRDGRYDKSTLFLDGLNYPTSIMAWKKGVLIVAAPEIFYAEDTNGDGRADTRETLFVGFGEGNQQHRVNGLRFGLDNWVYAANGDSGGKIRSTRTGKVVDISGRDLRIRPGEGLLQPQSGQAQFGRDRDDWGNWFGCNNPSPMWHYALADHYLRRNPNFGPPDPRIHVSIHHDKRLYPKSRTPARFNDPKDINRYSSACSTMVYRDDLFGPEFVGNSFVSEPVHNLVHREVMSPRGVTFTSRRADDEQESEFLASTDNNFRPTTIRTGPDGALWIADMYRGVIEHPQWIPDDWEKRIDLRAGKNRGRIWRVFPKNRPPRQIPKLTELNTAGLVAALDSPSGWQRDMVQQMLIWRGDKAAVAPLERLAATGKRPLARLHALCTLAGLRSLAEKALQRALSDPHPGVRRHAVRLAEPFLNESTTFGPRLSKMIDDPDPFVQLQLAYSLGEWQDPQSGDALAILAHTHRGDRYITAAVMCAIHQRNVDRMLENVLSRTPQDRAGEQLRDRMIRQATALVKNKALSGLVLRMTKPGEDKVLAWRLSAVASLLDELLRRDKRAESVLGSEATTQLDAFVSKARAMAANAEHDLGLRVAATQLVGHRYNNRESDLDLLAGLLAPRTAPALQTAAVRALAASGRMRATALLLTDWQSYAPQLRAVVLDAMLSRDDWTLELLSGIEKGQVLAAHIDATRRQRLLKHKNATLRKQAEKQFAADAHSSRAKIVADFQDVLQLTGGVDRGHKIYSKHCAICHRYKGEGHAVGADLDSLRDKSPAVLLVAILDPNRAVEAKFLQYTAVTDDGRTTAGILAAETATSITLRAQEGKDQVILRNRLEELQTTGLSLMPEGMEKELTHQNLADLIAYLAAKKPQ